MIVIGCDYIFGAAFSEPPLTTVTAFGEEAGRAATDLLISRFGQRDKSPRVDRIATHLTVRESAGRSGTSAADADRGGPAGRSARSSRPASAATRRPRRRARPRRRPATRRAQPWSRAGGG